MLLIVRHGETAPNTLGLFLGRSDPPLTEAGRRQARALADALPSAELVVSSPLTRARETAAAFGVAVTIDDRWIELDYGTYEGQSPAALSEQERREWHSDTSFAPPGGESLVTLGHRVRSACEAVRDQAARSTVVVITHVSPIKAALAWALGVSDDIAWRMYVEDAGVARIDIERDGPLLRWFNRGIVPVG